jgi:hypothetical protein
MGQQGIGEPQSERLAIRSEVHADRGDLGSRGKGPLPLREFRGPRDDLLERRVLAQLEGAAHVELRLALNCPGLPQHRMSSVLNLDQIQAPLVALTRTVMKPLGWEAVQTK